MILVIAETDL